MNFFLWNHCTSVRTTEPTLYCLLSLFSLFLVYAVSCIFFYEITILVSLYTLKKFSPFVWVLPYTHFTQHIILRNHLTKVTSSQTEVTYLNYETLWQYVTTSSCSRFQFPRILSLCCFGMQDFLRPGTLRPDFYVCMGYVVCRATSDIQEGLAARLGWM